MRADLPDWVIARLRKHHGDDEIMALARSLQHPAPLDLRVNTLKAPRQAVLDRLEADGTPAAPTRYSPIGVRLKEKIALNRHPMFLDGAVEVQDEGSQILGLLVEPKRTDMVVDFCAGAGGKTLQLGAAMGSHGRLYAYDVSDKRLANLTPRLRRSGLSNVHPQRISGENDTKVKRLRGKVDRVLVDAPCTGLGTLRRNPDLKTRQTEAGLAELTVKQYAILEAAASLVKPGGRIVYGTCSLLEDENEAIVERFLAAHPDFSVVPCAEILARLGLDIPGCERWLRAAAACPRHRRLLRRGDAARRVRRGLALLALGLAAACAGAQPAPRTGEPAAAARVEAYFTPGDDVARVISGRIDAARRTVQVQAYLFTNRRIAAALAKAARRGVAVELVADARQHEAGGLPVLKALDRAGVRIWLAGDFAAFHNKVVLVDAGTPSAVVVTGQLQLHAGRAGQERRERRGDLRKPRGDGALRARLRAASRAGLAVTMTAP